MKSIFYLVQICCLLLFTNSATALDKANAEKYFQFTITTINNTLQERQADFLKNPLKLVGYVDDELIPLWASDKTMRGLLSKKHWNELTPEQQAELSKVFDDTLQRYVQEGFKSYDGQEIEFVKLKLHPKKPRGLLTVKVVPNLLPSFNIQLKVEHKQEKWRIYDVMVQGVSYISLKKEGIRKAFKKGGVSLVLNEFIYKNQGFVPSGGSLTRSDT